MNDASELRHGYELVKRIRDDPDDVDGKLAPVLTQILSGADPDFDGLLRTTFLICTSGHGDLLNQWQHYAHAQGVCLELDTSTRLFPDGIPDEHNPFQQHPQDSVVPPGWYRVEYDRASQRAQVVGLLQRYEPWASPDPASSGVGEPPAWRLRAARELALMMCTFKHHAFEVEQEVRFVAPLTEGRSLCYRADASGLLPYLEMKSGRRSSSGSSFPRLPITRVTLGPTGEPRTGERRRVVEDFMISQGYEVPVERSEIPFLPS